MTKSHKNVQSSSLSSKSYKKPTRWLITGGCGFIGTSLIKNLIVEGGHYIRVLDNFSVGTRDDLYRVCEFIEVDSSVFDPAEEPSALHPKQTVNNSLCELVVGDILDAKLAMKVSEGIDVIVHLAANTGVGPSVENPRQDMEVNVIGTINMLEAARQNGVKRFIFASSSAPVGECEPPIHEELAPCPVSPYGASKLAGEGYCSAYFRAFGLETVALRFGNVYGPGSSNKSSVIAKFIKKALAGEVCEIYGDGNQTRDFLYIDDLIKATLKAANTPALNPHPLNSSIDTHSSALIPQSSPVTEAPHLLCGETFQIATNKEHTVNEVAEILKLVIKNNDIQMEVKYADSRLGDVRRNFSDTTKAMNILGWKSDIKLKDGIANTVEWFLRNR
jgi:UDP-glucose 4-epimerase